MKTRVALGIVAAVSAVGIAPAISLAGSVLAESYISPDGRELGLLFNTAEHGLKGQAVFRLLQDNRSIEILLTNTSDGVPNVPYFDNPSDQIISSLYFDLGAPGLNAGDPRIMGGAAYVGPDSYLVGPANKIAAQGTDLSNRWGYGNFKYTEEGLDFLGPNFVSTISAHSTPLSPGGSLAGPDWGAISAANLLGGHSAGLPATSDTVRFVLGIDREIPDLRSLISEANYKPYIEFGSDYQFFVGDDPPPETPAVPEPLTVVGLFLGLGAMGWALRGRQGLA